MKNQLTHEGYLTITKELEYLETIQYPEILRERNKALDEFDFEDYSEIQPILDEFAYTEERIAKLKLILEQSQIINRQPNTESVEIGSFVTVKENEEIFTYRIVDSIEANPIENKISALSPIGKALLNKRNGETVQVRTPEQVFQIEILNIY